MFSESENAPLNAVFLDNKKRNPERFKENARKLWKLICKMKCFNCKDVTAQQSEIDELQCQVKELRAEVRGLRNGAKKGQRKVYEGPEVKQVEHFQMKCSDCEEVATLSRVRTTAQCYCCAKSEKRLDANNNELEEDSVALDSGEKEELLRLVEMLARVSICLLFMLLSLLFIYDIPYI